MNILVAGGAGFVGSNLILKLLKLDEKVVATIHNRSPQIVDKRIKYIQCDLTKKEDCLKVCEGIDYVIMCAANTSGAAVIDSTPLVHVTPNVIMNTLMLDASYSNKVKKFIFLSSNTVYPPVEYPVKESDCTGEMFHKYFCVGWMKRFTEIMCEMYSSKITNPMKSVVVRPGNLYGEYDDFEWKTSHVIPSLVRKVVEEHSPIEVWGDGTDIKDFVYIGDFIDGLIKVLYSDVDGPINLAGGISWSVKDVLNTICKVENYNAAILYDLSKPKMIPNRYISISMASNTLRYSPRTTLEEGLRRTINWYKENSNG